MLKGNLDHPPAKSGDGPELGFRGEDWLPPLAAAITFTGLGLAKVYGLFHGIQGGGCKPAKLRACGTCPSWSRSANLALIVLLLAAGLGNLAILYMAVTRRPY
jgi:hypothetical protein